MRAHRVRVAVPLVIALVFEVFVVAAPALAQSCDLSVASRVTVGTKLVISGSSFPASTSVDITMTRGGTQIDAFSVTSDVNGAFRIELTPDNSDAGTTTVTASVAGSSCKATATFTVVKPGQPAATPSPAPKATPKPTAHPSKASGGVKSGTGAPTTAVADMQSGGQVPPSLVVGALMLVVVSGSSLLFGRLTRR